jgi:allantoicase
VIKVNPRAEVVFHAQKTLVKPGDEVTLVRFTVMPDGSVGKLNTMSKALVKRF